MLNQQSVGLPNGIEMLNQRRYRCDHSPVDQLVDLQA